MTELITKRLIKVIHPGNVEHFRHFFWDTYLINLQLKSVASKLAFMIGREGSTERCLQTRVVILKLFGLT